MAMGTVYIVECAWWDVPGRMAVLEKEMRSTSDCEIEKFSTLKGVATKARSPT